MRDIWIAALGAVLFAVGIVGMLGLAVLGPDLPVPPGDIDSPSVPEAGTDPGPFVVPEPRGPQGREVPRLSDEDASLGARIYLDGLDRGGRPIPRTAVGPGMMGGGCVTCHGVDGRGGRFTMMMWTFDAPDIRYDTLTSGHEHGEAWTDADILAAVVDGETPDGDRLDALMPRWDLTDEQFEALLDYLKELSER